MGFAIFREWLQARLAELGLPPLVLTDGSSTWQLGDGEAAATLQADRHELFRIISGRRSVTSVLDCSWRGDPTPYLHVLSPYALHG
jgi:hypothetical protein